jgi:hypothetical protein
LESEGELISALHPYEIRVFTCSWGIREIDLARGRIIHLRERDRLHWSEGICLGFVGERLQGDRGGFFKGYWHTSSAQAETTTFRSQRAVVQGDAGLHAGAVHLRRGSCEGFTESLGFKEVGERPYLSVEVKTEVLLSIWLGRNSL